MRDVQIDVAHGLEAAEPPADPPQAEDRLGVLGYCVLRHRCCQPVTGGWVSLPIHGKLRFTQAGAVRPGAGV